jgi:hypothetical protein
MIKKQKNEGLSHKKNRFCTFQNNIFQIGNEREKKELDLINLILL